MRGSDRPRKTPFFRAEIRVVGRRAVTTYQHACCYFAPSQRPTNLRPQPACARSCPSQPPYRLPVDILSLQRSDFAQLANISELFFGTGLERTLASHPAACIGWSPVRPTTHSSSPFAAYRLHTRPPAAPAGGCRKQESPFSPPSFSERRPSPMGTRRSSLPPRTELCSGSGFQPVFRYRPNSHNHYR